MTKNIDRRLKAAQSRADAALGVFKSLAADLRQAADAAVAVADEAEQTAASYNQTADKARNEAVRATVAANKIEDLFA